MESLRLWHNLHSEGTKATTGLLFQNHLWWVTDQNPPVPREHCIWVSLLGMCQGQGAKLYSWRDNRMAFSASSILGNVQNVGSTWTFSIRLQISVEGRHAHTSMCATDWWSSEILLRNRPLGRINSRIKVILTECPLFSIVTKTMWWVSQQRSLGSQEGFNFRKI